MSKVRVAVVGCGSVSQKYVPDLKQSSAVELVAVCDNRVEFARRHAETYAIERYFSDIDRMLAEVDFELLVNLTPMQFHAPFNRKGLEAGRNVWCEKPIATNLADAHALIELARSRGVKLWGAPNSPTSPAFETMAKILACGEIGRACVAHGIYGWSGPDWPGAAWFYQKGGGSLFDLGVYNVTTLTGLLGPARSVIAMAGAAVPERVIAGETVKVEADDNTALILDHGGAVYSVIQTGFVYGAQREDWTIQVIGTNGAMTMGGYDWAPADVAVYAGHQMRSEDRKWEVRWQDDGSYKWEHGAAYIAECLANGEQPILSGEHALHVLEVMLAALESAKSGRREPVESDFPWPLIH
ncbi:MAG TPA: Gfo/Idh/MocA family oxidoreductase [Ktedonobacteraceae bacterium]|jgi:predicted dehydrogenase|nr:Gfo/Idh/MocA family oxidoreductase [Ktedonobacteraceae bacterium]